MPGFYEPWTQYKKGHLFFGLAGPRTRLMMHLGCTDEGYIVDDYALVAHERAPCDSGLALRYDPGFIESLNAHSKTQAIVGQNMATLYQNPDKTEFQAVGKRKSKGALTWIIDKTVHSIHFTLDDIDMPTVPAKSYDGSKGGLADSPVGKAHGVAWNAKVRAITASELRWIYRNRGRQAVSSRIQFWFDLKPCAPPWSPPHPSAWVDAWSAYHPTQEALPEPW